MTGAMSLLQLMVQVLYLFAPLLLSAAISGFVMRRHWLSALYVPVDQGRTFRGQPLFGRTKTWRGFAVAVFGCIAGVACQSYLLATAMAPFALLDYANVDTIAFGTAMGIGAMLGELPNSFVKRRLGVASGARANGAWSILFYVWDQIDLLTLAWPAISPWVQPTFARVLMSIALALLLHPLSSLIGFVIGARESAR